MRKSSCESVPLFFKCAVQALKFKRLYASDHRKKSVNPTLRSLRKVFVKVIKDILVLKEYIYEEKEESKSLEGSRTDTSDIKMAEISIPVFDGQDYAHWKKRITMFLKLKKCATVIERERISTDKEEEWAEMDLKAINYIYSAISNKQLEFVSDLDTAFKIMKKFDGMYMKESTALQIICRNKLERIRLKDYQESSAFISAFRHYPNRTVILVI